MNYARLGEADNKLAALQKQVGLIIKSQLAKDASPKQLDLMELYDALAGIRADVQVAQESCKPLDNKR